MPSRETLEYLKAMPLDLKVRTTEQRIREFYYHCGHDVWVSFSGGKDSTVLLHIARSIFPDIPAVFSDTGLEYPEIRAFAKSHENVTSVRPEMRFDQVIRRYGYPVISKEVAECIYYARRISGGNKESNTVKRSRQELENTRLFHASPNTAGRETIRRKVQLMGQQPYPNKEPTEFTKLYQTDAGMQKSRFNKPKWLPLCQQTDFKISHYCCQVMKKSPMDKYKHETGRWPIIATMTEESQLRMTAWLQTGCNVLEGRKQASHPMSFWTEQDVLQYIREHNLDLCSVYGEIKEKDGKLCTTGASRTGCIFCGFGGHREKGETRWQRILRTHPRQYEYCLGGGEYIDNPDYVPDAPEYDTDGWRNWNPRRIWVPNEKGLGMKHVFDQINEIYGEPLYRYWPEEKQEQISIFDMMGGTADDGK